MRKEDIQSNRPVFFYKEHRTSSHPAQHKLHLQQTQLKTETRLTDGQQNPVMNPIGPISKEINHSDGDPWNTYQYPLIA